MHPTWIRLLGAAVATAASPISVADQVPVRIPAPNGEVVLTSRFDADEYSEDHLAPLRRSGDWVYLSGIAIGAQEPMSKEVFRARLRHAFDSIRLKLKAAGLGFQNVVSIRTYHVWHSEHFLGSKDDHNLVYQSVASEYFKPPYPTWTAVGVDELYGPNAVVELELVAQLPRSERREKSRH